MYHYMRLFTLPNDSFMLLKAGLNDEQVTKCIYLKELMLLTDERAVRMWTLRCHNADYEQCFCLGCNIV
jgi:hypothetical protein